MKSSPCTPEQVGCSSLRAISTSTLVAKSEAFSGQRLVVRQLICHADSKPRPHFSSNSAIVLTPHPCLHGRTSLCAERPRLGRPKNTR